MTPPLLVEQFQGQQREHRGGGGDHFRAGIPGLGDELIEAESCQQRQKEEDARDARPDRAAGLGVQLATVRDVGRLRAGSLLAGACPERSSSPVGEKKGGATPLKLYHLAQDIGEANDLAAKHPDKFKDLEGAWQKWNAQLVKPLWGAGAKGSAQEEE